MHCLYVCQFSSGHIKVGRSRTPHARINAHAERVSCLGVSLVRSDFFVVPGAVEAREQILISRCAERAEHRFKDEWFLGLDEDEVIRWAEEIALMEVSDEASVTALDRACDAVGGVSALARELGVSAQTVTNWKARGGVPPIPHCPAIERITRVSRKELRPEDWRQIWPDLELA